MKTSSGPSRACGDILTISYHFAVLKKSGMLSQWILILSLCCYETQRFGSEIWRCGSKGHQNVIIFYSLVVFM